jgi:hypothetical protein
VIDPEPRRDVKDFASHIELSRCRTAPSWMERFYQSVSGRFFLSTQATSQNWTGTFRSCIVSCCLNCPRTSLYMFTIFLRRLTTLRITVRASTPNNTFSKLYSQTMRILSVRFVTHAMSRLHPNEMQAALGPKVAIDPLFFGASFWMQSSEPSAARVNPAKPCSDRLDRARARRNSLITATACAPDRPPRPPPMDRGVASLSVLTTGSACPQSGKFHLSGRALLFHPSKFEIEILKSRFH